MVLFTSFAAISRADGGCESHGTRNRRLGPQSSDWWEAGKLIRELGDARDWDRSKRRDFQNDVDWGTYRSLPLGFDLPEVETVLIDRRDVDAMGAGETTITLAAAAIGNAIFDATGARIRQLPFTPERVKAALAQRA